MNEPLSDEELGGKCSVVNLLHPTGIHFKSPTCEGWFAITAHPTPEKKKHFRQERWESVIHGFDGTLAEHHDDPCYICDHDALITQLAEMTRERDRLFGAWDDERVKRDAAESELTRLRAIEVAAREFRAWMKRANVGITATDDLFVAMDNLDDPSFAQQVVRTQMNREADPGVEYGSGGSIDPAPDAVRPTGQTEGT